MAFKPGKVIQSIVGACAYLCISEEEHCVLSLHSCHCIQLLEVFSEGLVVIPTRELNLETVVTIDVGCQPGGGRDRIVNRAVRFLVWTWE